MLSSPTSSMLHKKYCYQLLFTLAWSRPRGGVEGPKGRGGKQKYRKHVRCACWRSSLLRDTSWSGGSVIRGLVAIGDIRFGVVMMLPMIAMLRARPAYKPMP